jgi:cell division protein FtsI/penicillin-binding protein 2
VFKVVTAAALLRAGVPLSEEVCGNGGHTRLKPRMLEGDEDAGGACTKFEDVLPYSRNVAMAKLAANHLTPKLLREEASRFYFDRPLPVDFPTTQSQAPIPTNDDFAFATTAAGFGDVKLSALHGAMLAMIPGNSGVLVPPHLIAKVDGVDASEVPQPRPAERVLDEDQAAALQAMMTATVAHGTASRSFASNDRGYHSFHRVPVAGKTGSLTDHRGKRGKGGLDYTWFVGTAPAHDPKIAIGVSMVNDEWDWYARALDITKMALNRYFTLHPEDARTEYPVARAR